MESGGQQYTFSLESDGYQFGKLLTSFIVTSSVAKIVREAIRNNVVDETFRDNIQIKIGSFVIGALVCENVWKNTEEKIDRFHRTYGKVQKEWENAKQPPARVESNVE
jgi:hypothetical protein